MPPNLIYGADPSGRSFETVQLIIGISVMVLGLVGIIVYLRWKLPRHPDLTGAEHGGEDPAEAERGAEDRPEGGYQ